MEIQNKIAIVNGPIEGVGYCTVCSLLKSGAQYVAIFDLKRSNSEDTINELRETFGKQRVEYFLCDTTDIAEFTTRFDDVMALYRRVDILVNLAATDVDQDQARLIDSNFVSIINGNLLALNRMGKHKGHEGGIIINVSTILGLTEHPLFPIYSATKKAIVDFTKGLKVLSNLINVRVVAICPGLTTTTLVHNLSQDVLNFFSDELIKITEWPAQPPENVSLAIIKIIQKGENGAVWVAEDNNSPFALKDPMYYINC